MTWKSIFFTIVTLSCSAFASPMMEGERGEKSLSLFSIVQFQNDECQAKTSSTTQGICYSSTDCSSRSGVADGNCAAGFGVCCTFIVDDTAGGAISQNCSYIQNNGYPSSLSTAAATTVSYTINPVITDICQLRFDIVNLKLEQTASTGLCTDTLAIVSPTGVNPPSLCGTSSGDHVYSEVGTSSTATTVTVTLAVATSSTARSWKVKVTQIECYNTNKPPTDCVQWYTPTVGTFQTLGFTAGLLLTNLNYAICFKANAGYCGMEFSTDTGTSSPDPFGLYDAINTAASGRAGNYNCDTNWLGIPNAVATTAISPAIGINTFCGAVFNSAADTTGAISVTGEGMVVTKGLPFKINVISHATNVIASTGAKLVYTMTGC